MNKVEVDTVQAMICLYCRKNHIPNDILCKECNDLLAYATKRILHCQFGADKPICRDCRVHCFSISKREEIKK